MKYPLITVLFVAALFSVREDRYAFAQESQVMEFYSLSNEDRINDQVSFLQPLALGESLNRLHVMEYYEWPGARIRSKIYPMTPKGDALWDEDTMKIVWSNRLFRKCFAETAALPKEKTAAIINAEIKKTLPLYLAEYGPFGVQGQSIYDGSEGKDGKPTLLGLRYKLFALTIIAGSLELSDAAPAVRELAELALEQKEKLTGTDKSFESRFHIQMASLCNAFILSCGLYGTCPAKDKPEWRPYVGRWTERKLVGYDAPHTEFDRLASFPLVSDKNGITVRWLDKSTDADVVDLLRLTKPEEKE